MIVIPKTVVWYRVFCFSVSAVLSLLIPLGVAIYFRAPSLMTGEVTEGQIHSAAITCISAGIFMAGTNLAVAFLPKTPIGWAIGLTNLLLACVTAVLLPATIPLLLNWNKSETKSYFGIPDDTPYQV